jgi:hypothetical protein
VYPAALTADSRNASAAQLLAFLGSSAARPIFEKQGFTVLQRRDGAQLPIRLFAGARRGGVRRAQLGSVDTG